MHTSKEKRIFNRYSSSFQRKVVTEIESGKLSISEARKLYDIRGAETIQQWIKKTGKRHLLNTVVRIEMKDEPQKIREQEQKIRALQAALSDAQLKIIVLESTIEVLEESVGKDVKKSSDTKLLRVR